MSAIGLPPAWSPPGIVQLLAGPKGRRRRDLKPPGVVLLPWAPTDGRQGGRNLHTRCCSYNASTVDTGVTTTSTHRAHTGDGGAAPAAPPPAPAALSPRSLTGNRGAPTGDGGAAPTEPRR